MKVKLCEIVQQLSHFDILKLETVFGSRKAIKDYAFIIHDRDNGVEPHIHIAIRLNDSYDTKYIAEWFGVPEQYVNKVKGRWSDMLKYLTHANAQDKYQYSDDDVVSNFDWKVDRDKGGDSRLGEILDGIADGNIREYNYFEYMTDREFIKYKKQIELAYQYRADKLKGVDRKMECIFITGGSGTGKTTYAKDIAIGKGYSLFVSSGSNDILDGYKGEDCIILDDLRPSCMKITDLLKMLDNHTSSTVKSRYKNKVLECKLIIITSVLPLEQWYAGVQENENEPIKQFKRRCRSYASMTKDYLHIQIYNPKEDDYFNPKTFPNPCKLKYVQEVMSEEEQLDFMYETFTGLGDLVKDQKAVVEQMKLVKDDDKMPF